MLDLVQQCPEEAVCELFVKQVFSDLGMKALPLHLKENYPRVEHNVRRLKASALNVHPGPVIAPAEALENGWRRDGICFREQIQQAGMNTVDNGPKLDQIAPARKPLCQIGVPLRGVHHPQPRVADLGAVQRPLQLLGGLLSQSRKDVAICPSPERAELGLYEILTTHHPWVVFRLHRGFTPSRMEECHGAGGLAAHRVNGYV